MREVSGWQSAAPATSPVFSGWIKPDRGRWGTSEKNSGATWRGDFQSPIPARPFRRAPAGWSGGGCSGSRRLESR